MLELFEKYNSNVITFTYHQQADDYITELKKSTSPDLTLKTENGYFNHRVAAVIVNDNKLLAQKTLRIIHIILSAAEFVSVSRAKTHLSEKLRRNWALL